MNDTKGMGKRSLDIIINRVNTPPKDLRGGRVVACGGATEKKIQ